jgi:hypothetical protein
MREALGWLLLYVAFAGAALSIVRLGSAWRAPRWSAEECVQIERQRVWLGTPKAPACTCTR